MKSCWVSVLAIRFIDVSFSLRARDGQNGLACAKMKTSFQDYGLKAVANEGTLVRKHCCSCVSLRAQTGKHLLRTQNVSEQNQKHFLCPGHKICVRNKCYARGQTGKHLCQQQCVRNNVSSFASTFSPTQPELTITHSTFMGVTQLGLAWHGWPHDEKLPWTCVQV